MIPSPIPYLIVVWSIGLFVLHLVVFYFVYLALTNPVHGPERVQTRGTEDSTREGPPEIVGEEVGVARTTT